jgi:hypothetical protein
MSYIATPIVIILLIITVVSVVIGLRQAKNILAEGDVPSGGKRAPMIFLGVLTAFIIYSLLNSASIPDYASKDRVFPMFVASVTLIGALILMVQMMIKPETHTLFADRERSGEDQDASFGLWPTLGWFAFLLVLTSLTGFILALGIFLISFLRIRAGLGWLHAVLYAAAGIAFMMFMAWTLGRDFPPGLLQSYLDLPWPFT